MAMKRSNLVGIKCTAIALFLVVFSVGCSAQKEEEQGWKDYSALVKKIVPPK